MNEHIGLRVYGTPAPQGSKRHVGHGIMVESSAKVKPWREAVKHASLENEPLDGPLVASLLFLLPRPKGHYGTGRNAGTVKESAPHVPAVRPDIDKLVRSTLDGLKDAGCYRDDAQIVRLIVSKEYADGEPPGVYVDLGVSP